LQTLFSFSRFHLASDWEGAIVLANETPRSSIPSPHSIFTSLFASPWRRAGLSLYFFLLFSPFHLSIRFYVRWSPPISLLFSISWFVLPSFFSFLRTDILLLEKWDFTVFLKYGDYYPWKKEYCDFYIWNGCKIVNQLSIYMYFNRNLYNYIKMWLWYIS